MSAGCTVLSESWNQRNCGFVAENQPHSRLESFHFGLFAMFEVVNSVLGVGISAGFAPEMGSVSRMAEAVKLKTAEETPKKGFGAQK